MGGLAGLYAFSGNDSHLLMQKLSKSKAYEQDLDKCLEKIETLQSSASHATDFEGRQVANDQAKDETYRKAALQRDLKRETNKILGTVESKMKTYFDFDSFKKGLMDELEYKSEQFFAEAENGVENANLLS